MKVAFLFPGQGVGVEREGRAWCERSEAVRSLLEVGARETGVSLEDQFARARRGIMPTEILEPFHTAICLGVEQGLLRRGVRPDVVTGHSLGEIPACASAGCCSPEEAVALAAVRGRLMAREAALRPGGMIALNRTDRGTAEAAVAYGRGSGIADIAAHKAPDQWVVSGEWPALRRLSTRFRGTPVQVSGAWHGGVLAGAQEEFRAAARNAISGQLRIPFVSNRTGLAVERADELPDLLAEQLTNPVQWVRVMETLTGLGVTDLVIVGPGRMLRGLIWFNLGAGAVVHSTETLDDLDRVGRALAR